MTTLTLNTPNDVRNFAGTNGSSNLAVLVSADGTMSFSSVDQAVNIASIIGTGLIINGVNSSITVQVNNSLVISNITFNNVNFSINTSLILSGNVIFNNCSFISSIAKPFSITGSVISFNECSFTNINNPVGDGTYTSSNFVNSSNAFIYGSIGSISDININNCTFISNIADRYPFISFELPQFSSTLQNCYINDNKFISTISADDIRAAVVIISTISTSSIPLEPARMINCNIDSNFCNKNQMFLITCIPKIASTTYIAAPATVDCSISNNICGTIGYMNRFNIPQNYTTISLFSKDKEGCLVIEKNSCKLIATLNNQGFIIEGSAFNSNSSKAIIKNNSCSWIRVDNSGNTGSNPVDRVSLTIDDNIFTASNSAFLFSLTDGGALPNNLNTALVVSGADSSGLTELFIINNKFYQGVSVNALSATTTYTYFGCILIADSAKILNNSFNGVTSDAVNSTFINISPIVNTATYFITGNKFNRGSSLLKNYIFSSSAAIFTVVNNYFDSTTVDGTSTTLSNFNTSLSVIYEKNKNQTGQLAIMLNGFGSGITSGANINMLTPEIVNAVPVSSVSAINVGTVMSITCTDDQNVKEVLWTSSIHGLPSGVKILNAQIGTFLSSGSFNGAGTGNMSIVLTSTKSSTNILDAKNGASTNTILSQAFDAQANQAALLASSQLVTLDSSANNNFITSSGNTITFALLLSFHVLTGGSIVGWAFSPVVVTYTW